MNNKRGLVAAYWALAAALFVGLSIFVFNVTPVVEDDGPIQKIYYVHMPVAINTFLACLICFIASVGYLLRRESWWDDLAAAAASVSVVFCSGVLLTGMIWGHTAWGHWWMWTPRLTFSLMLWLLYVVYLLVRSSVETSQRRAVVSAVYGVVAFLDVPIVFLTARLLPDQHRGNVPVKSPLMLATLLLWFVPVTMVLGGLIAAKYRENRRIRAALAQAAGTEDAATELAGGAA